MRPEAMKNAQLLSMVTGIALILWNSFLLVKVRPALSMDFTIPQNTRQTLLAQTEVPISRIIFTSAGVGVFIVPNSDTTQSAYGGDLRLYDVHLAKMFEITHFECNQPGRGMPPNQRIMWRYEAGDGDIKMGAFDISCRLANQMAREYGLGRTETTNITYYRARATEEIPILNITGDKIPRWINFLQTFRPEFPD
jgi:serine/threonine-protein kinase